MCPKIFFFFSNHLKRLKPLLACGLHKTRWWAIPTQAAGRICCGGREAKVEPPETRSTNQNSTDQRQFH